MGWAVRLPAPKSWEQLVQEFRQRFPKRTEEDLRAIFLAHIEDGMDEPLFQLVQSARQS